MKVDTKAIRARADALAPAPWEVTPNLDTAEMVGRFCLSDVVANEVECVVATGLGPVELADFIAAARSDVPALCDRVEELETALRAEFACESGAHDADRCGQCGTCVRLRAALGGGE